MDTLNKYDLIKEVIVHMSDLADAKGVDKCVLIITAVQKLNQIERMLRDEDSNHESAILELTRKIDIANTAKGDDDDAPAEAE